MRSPPFAVRIFPCSEPADPRRSFNGLSPSAPQHSDHNPQRYAEAEPLFVQGYEGMRK